MTENIYWILLLPLFGFLINGVLLGKLPRRVVSLVACGTVGGSFLLSLMSFLELKALPPELRTIEQTMFSWISSGDLHVNFGFLLDPL